MLVGGNIGNLMVTQEAADDWAGNVSTILANLALITPTAAVQFLQNLAETLDFRVNSKQENHEAAAVVRLLIRQTLTSPLRLKSLTDSLQLTEAMMHFQGQTAPFMLTVYFQYAHILAEVGLVDKARAYIARLNSLRMSLQGFKPDITFINHVRYFVERLACVQPLKRAKPESSELLMRTSELRQPGEKRHSRDLSLSRRH